MKGCSKHTFQMTPNQGLCCIYSFEAVGNIKCNTMPHESDVALFSRRFSLFP